jgi:major membrane immunogen (membrane-anchored lipoprotein)
VFARSEDMQNVTFEITSTCDKIRGLASDLEAFFQRSWLQLDAVSGATFSSKVILKAGENALESAR